MVYAVVWKDPLLICCKGCISRFTGCYVYIYAIWLCIDCERMSFYCFFFCRFRVVEMYCHTIASVDYDYRKRVDVSSYSCCCLVQSLYLCGKDIEGLVARSWHY